jgi:hypothetical protein
MVTTNSVWSADHSGLAASLRQTLTNRHRAVLAGGSLNQLPRPDTNEAMRGFSFALAEPRKTDGHPAADRLARGKPAEPAHEQQWRFATFLETGDVRAVQINFRRALAGGDVDFGQAAAAAGERDPAGDFKFAGPPGKGWCFP